MVSLRSSTSSRLPQPVRWDSRRRSSPPPSRSSCARRTPPSMPRSSSTPLRASCVTISPKSTTPQPDTAPSRSACLLPDCPRPSVSWSSPPARCRSRDVGTNNSSPRPLSLSPGSSFRRTSRWLGRPQRPSSAHTRTSAPSRSPPHHSPAPPSAFAPLSSELHPDEVFRVMATVDTVRRRNAPLADNDQTISSVIHSRWRRSSLTSLDEATQAHHDSFGFIRK
mmetsp:Transcript_36867/g.85710  ORF Transcript_36867/g.85710 Transcript_36867/m.85710 type:complete len:223 (-) Transcript_36867:429-1097(-)